MNAWASRRKLFIFVGTVLALLLLVGAPIFFFFEREPSCQDGVRNGDEAGVDCGGSCTRLCVAEALPLILKGDPRIVSLTDASYAVVVETQNPNPSASVYRGGYTLTIYGTDGLSNPVEVTGSTFVPRGSVFALYFGPYPYSGQRPSRATFVWHEDGFDWEKEVAVLPVLATENTVFNEAGDDPRLSATLVNQSSSSVSNIELVALIYGEDGNITSASKTFVPRLDARGRTELVFTWPAAFAATSTAAEILPRILPDPSFIR